MAKKKALIKLVHRKNLRTRVIGVSFVLYTVSFFLFVYIFTSDRWVKSTDPRSYAAAAKKTPQPAPKKKTAKPCSQWCAACGGFCADGENETCNSLAASRCGEKPCYAAGPDGKSYLCTQVPAAKPAEEPVVKKPVAGGCDGASSTCSCDPNPVCNTILRDTYHSSCPEYCQAYTKNTTTPPVVTNTLTTDKSSNDSLAKHSIQTMPPNETTVLSTKKPEKFGARCVASANDCGNGLECMATPYGYYCAIPAKSYKTLKNGENCDSIVECSNSCIGSFFRNTSGKFFCGSPPTPAVIIATRNPQYPAKMGTRCTISKNECGDGLACITTPYGYYCGVPGTEYQKKKDGSSCGSVLECSNQCSGGFYRNAAGNFYCGKPPASTQGTSITAQSTLTKTITTSPTVRVSTTTRIPSRTPTMSATVKNVCDNPILNHAAVGELNGDILPVTYVPNDLVTARSYFNANTKLEDPKTKMSKSALPMFTCFEKEVMKEGYTLGIYDGGGFRDCEAQKEKNSVDCGHSEHQTGLAADLFVIDQQGVRHELTVNPKSKGYGNADLEKILNKADDCGLAHPITYDDPHFFAVAAVVDTKNMAGYTPIPRKESNMDDLNDIIRKQQAACK